MTFLQKLKIKIGSNLIASATGRWHPKYPLEAYFYGDKSFSQCSEDLAVINMLSDLGHEGPVNYIDIGCFHPIKYSNTFYHYLRGGSGVVVDMNKEYKEEFQRLRPRDKFVTALVSNSKNELFVRCHNMPNDRIVDSANKQEGKTMQPKPLAEILDEHWPEKQKISFLDIDCEGHETQVLRSNNWDKYRPIIIIVEGFSKTDLSNLEGCMNEFSYASVARIRHALFFVDKFNNLKND
jgi:hypothetical protein